MKRAHTRGNNAQERIRAAAIKISKPERWIKGAYARDDEGYVVAPEGPDAVCWCLIGALLSVGRVITPNRVIIPHLPDPVIGVAGFNDNPKTTHKDVMRVLRKAFVAAGSEE